MNQRLFDTKVSRLLAMMGLCITLNVGRAVADLSVGTSVTNVPA